MNEHILGGDRNEVRDFFLSVDLRKEIKDYTWQRKILFEKKKTPGCRLTSVGFNDLHSSGVVDQSVEQLQCVRIQLSLKNFYLALCGP